MIYSYSKPERVQGLGFALYSIPAELIYSGYQREFRVNENIPSPHNSEL